MNITALTPLKRATSRCLTAALAPFPSDACIASGNSVGSDKDTRKLGAGEKAQARIVLSKFPTAAVVGVGLGIAGVAIAIISLNNSFKHMFDNSQAARFDWSISAIPTRNAASADRVRWGQEFSGSLGRNREGRGP